MMDHSALGKLLLTAKGEMEPDVMIRGGRVVNVFTNRIDEDVTILVKDGYIASIENGASRPSGEKTGHPHAGIPVIDADGLYLCPGFIDSHTHLDSMQPFYGIVPYALRGGTTTVVSECAIVAQSCGTAALHSFIDSTKGYPLRCYFLAPGLTPTFPNLERAKGISFKDFSNVLKRDDFVGIGEAYWTRMIEGDERLLKKAALAISLRKTLEGHSAGARGSKLIQYMTTGITSCHESTTADEALEKLRYGIYVMLREGWVRKELKELAALKSTNVDERRLILASDVFDPVMLVEEGYMDVVVRTAIELGFSPMTALKMATINPADYYGLRHLGAIAPLRCADILFIDDLAKVSIKKVMANGRMVYSDGKFIPEIRPYRYPAAMKKTITTRKMREEDFRIKARASQNRVRIMEIANPTITKESVVTLGAASGYLEKDVADDILPIAVIHRNDKRKIGRGFIRGTTIKEGAFATTVVWDTSNILVVGSSERDMMAAVNRLIDIQGGVVVVRKGKVIYEFPMPVYGLIPPYAMEEVKNKTKQLDESVKEIGSLVDRPFLTLQTIPFTGLPFLRITDRGLVDIKTKKVVSIFLD